MIRSAKLSLEFVTDKKRKMIFAILEAYRAAVNFYIEALWQRGITKWDNEIFHSLVHTRLSERYKTAALNQAISVVMSTRESVLVTGKTATMPNFSGGRATLDAKFVTIEDGRGTFDLVIKLATLHKSRPINIPTKRTEVLNKWLARPGAVLKQGCDLAEDFVTLWVELPDEQPKETGNVLGIDINMNKLIVDSNGTVYGGDFKAVREKVCRRKPGSKGMKRARTERDHFINRTVKQLPWNDLRALGVENLTGIKTGKRKGRTRAFRRARAPWTFRRVLNRVEMLAQENRVRLVPVQPAYTSRTYPSCSAASKENRRGEYFRCICCGYKADADFVGAVNVLARTQDTMGSLESPMRTR